MKALKIVSILSVILVVMVLFAFLVITPGYNRAVALDEGVKTAWADVDSQLQRRFDLINNLVETVKGMAAQEEKIYLGVAEARNAYLHAASIQAKALAATQFDGALARVLLLQETYPELRSNSGFMNLMYDLDSTETRLNTERQKYNEAVKKLNTYARSLHGRPFAIWAGVDEAGYYNVPAEARTNPQVSFK